MSTPLVFRPTGCLLPLLSLLSLVRPAAAQTQPADTSRTRITYSEETVPDSTAYAFEAGLGRKLRKSSSCGKSTRSTGA
jgi:hypothetical protein